MEEAKVEEIKALAKNGIWEPTPLPAGKMTVRCKWVFTIKYMVDGKLEQLKARSVAEASLKLTEWIVRNLHRLQR